MKTQPATKEAYVMLAVDGWMTAMGIKHWRNNTGAYKDDGRFIRFGYVGSSDFLGICPDGRFLAVECKRPGGVLTAAQKEFLDMVNGSGGVGVMCDSIGSLEQQLKERGIICQRCTK